MILLMAVIVGSDVPREDNCTPADRALDSVENSVSAATAIDIEISALACESIQVDVLDTDITVDTDGDSVTESPTNADGEGQLNRRL
jgi:hypothetical protein